MRLSQNVNLAAKFPISLQAAALSSGSGVSKFKCSLSTLCLNNKLNGEDISSEAEGRRACSSPCQPRFVQG